MHFKAICLMYFLQIPDMNIMQPRFRKISFGANVYVSDSWFCLFDLWFGAPVNINGHVRMLSPFYGTFTQHQDLNIRMS